MDKSERQKIYTLLSKFFPQAKQLKDRETLTAWGIVLEDYTYDDVKTAVLRYAAKNKFFPDLADITGTLTPIPTAEPEPVYDRCRPYVMGPGERRHLEEMKAWQAEWHASLRAKGLPTFREATQAGMTPGQWLRLLDSKGGFDD